MFVIGIASPLLRYRDMKQSGYINNLDNGFFMCALFIGIILAVFCSLLSVQNIMTEQSETKLS